MKIWYKVSRESLKINYNKVDGAIKTIQCMNSYYERSILDQPNEWERLLSTKLPSGLETTSILSSSGRLVFVGIGTSYWAARFSEILWKDYVNVNGGNNPISIQTSWQEVLQKVLVLVDIIFPGWIPFPYLAIAKDTAGFIGAHDIALNNYNFDTIVAGHLTRLGTRADVEVQREFVMDLERASGKANQEVL